MAAKRSREHDSAGDAPAKKQRKGFSVGPANLPEGTHKRKVQQIKKDLIHKAKLKKEYAKLKAREEPSTPHKSVYERAEAHEEPADPVKEPTLDPHPDRLELLERKSPEPGPNGIASSSRPGRRPKRPRAQPYKNETELAQKRRDEAEARRKAREEAEKQREKKLAERERFRKTMAKARGGPDGRRKLGRESTVLLEKAKRLMGQV